ncbi:hypothetical protein OF83DRAFT_1063017 [Amylostereum chailletii]|nr:hypothetical protein OF83DRAFT_1063017 [Amylostereum chailletii]
MTGVTPRPDVSYFIPVPISFPLIGLVQFTQFLVAARVSGLSLASFRAKFAGASGLSQGVAVAASIASIVDDASFIQNACMTIKWLFFAGLRAQQKFPITALDPAIVQASLDGEHGTPSPMLTVIGLPAEKLSLHVASANEKSPPDSQIMVSLHNCPDVFVITGRPEALYTFLARMKPVEGVRFMRFLQISAPFHNPSLQCVAEQVCAEDLTNEEVWTVSELQMAVYNTEDGSDLRECSGSLTQSISDQIFTHPLHWIRATNWPASATHAVDFGPGGANGAGAIAARNFHAQGRSVRFISIGDRGEGDTEFYSAKKLMLETLDV